MKTEFFRENNVHFGNNEEDARVAKFGRGRNPQDLNLAVRRFFNAIYFQVGPRYGRITCYTVYKAFGHCPI